MSRELDKNIRNLFEDYRVDYDPHSWSAMEDKLNKDIDPVEQFDLNIQDKLNQYSEPYDYTTWPALEKRMAETAALQQKIITTKCLELLAIFLLMVSIVNYSNTPLLPKHQYADRVVTPPSAEKTSTNNNLEIDVKPSQHLPLEVSFRNDYTSTDHNLPDNEATGQQLKTNNTNADDTNIVVPRHNSISEQASLSITDMEGESTQSLRNLNANRGRKPNTTTPTFTSAEAHHDETIGSSNMDKIEALQAAPIMPFENEREIALALPAIALNTPILKILEKEKFVGLVVSTDLNLINRPLDFQLFQDQLNYGDLGYSFGLLFASKLGRHEMESGILYSLHSTNPNQTEKLSVENSYYDREFNLQKFDLFKIPLDFKYHIVDTKQSNFYVSIGMDLHVIVDATYNFTDRLKSGTPKPQYKIENKSTLEKRKDLKGGLFDGGTLQNNSFVNVGGGIGYIRNVGNYSIFTEANYKHHIFAAKLGPNNENINTLSIKLGARKRI